MTIKERINDYRNQLQDMSEVTNEKANRILVELSALSGNITTELINRQMIYNQKKMECLEEVKSVARAVMMAETSEEYRNYQEVKGYQELVRDLTRSLKYFIRSLGDDWEMSRNT